MFLNQSICQVPGRDPRQWPWPQQPKCWRWLELIHTSAASTKVYLCADVTVVDVEHTLKRKALCISTVSFVQEVCPQGAGVAFRNITAVDDTCLERDSALPEQRYGCSQLSLSTSRTIRWDNSRSLAISRKILHAPRVTAANMASFCWCFCSPWRPAFVRNVDITLRLLLRYCSNR
jgi:hypothetical protein